MFRQRLKGGHRVGASSKPATLQPQNVNATSPPLFQTPTTYSVINSSAEGSWQQGASSSNNQHDLHSFQNASEPTMPPQKVSQLQNGADAQNQGYDDWNWGNEDNWNDWGNVDMAYFNSNNNNSFNPHQPSLNYQQQAFNTEQKPLMYKSEGQSSTHPSSGQQKTIVSEQQTIQPLANVNENANAIFQSVDLFLKEDKLTQRSSIPTSLNINKAAQGHDLSGDNMPTTFSDDLSEKKAELDSFLPIKTDNINTSHNLTHIQQQESYQQDCRTVDSYNNSPSTKLEDFFSLSKNENLANMSEYESNAKLSNIEDVQCSSTSSYYNQHPNIACSEDENKIVLESFKQVEHSVENESTSSFWDGTVYKEASLPGNEELEGESVDQFLNNCFSNDLASEKLYSLSSENKNVTSTSAGDCTKHVNQVNQEINCTSDDTQNDSSAQPVASWDDEWGDGWELKPHDSQNVDPSLLQQITSTEISNLYDNNSDKLKTYGYEYADTSNSVKCDQLIELNNVRESYKSESVAEVANIQVLDQELQGIFSGPSEAALVINTDIEQYEQKYSSSHSLQEDNSDAKDLSEHNVKMCVSDKEMETEHNTIIKDDAVYSEVAGEYEEISDLENLQNKRIISCTTSVPTSFSGQSSSESTLSNLPQAISLGNMNTNEVEDSVLLDDKYTDGNATPTSSNLVSSAPLVGPSGSFPNLQARKGSPFQPPVSRRSIPPQQLNVSNGNFQHPGAIFDSSAFQDKQDYIQSERNPILSNFQPPEQNIKLCVVERPAQLVSPSEFTGTLQSNKPSALPVKIKNEPITPYDKDIPPAHLNSMQSKFEPPKVRTLESISDTSMSPSVLDLSHFSVQKEERALPAFKRMVPGESSKGESTLTSSYQLPVIVPAMPSGRVVTGNANPQPVPSVRIKQEPNEIRAPPDGPDTGEMRDESPGVIPPIRSETIGSEDHEVRIPRPDRRDDERHNERDRAKDNTRDFYAERRNDGGYYANDSSHRVKSRERNYDSYYGERRYGRRAIYDDLDDENDDDNGERRFSANIQERRRRAFRDELERYGERDRDTNMEKRRNRDARYNHEDEDLYYEDQPSDRSRPSSRSSSYGNLESETGQGSHSSHVDEYYDRGPKGRERYREKSIRDPFRDYTHYKKRESKERDTYGRAFNPYLDRYGSRDMYDPHSYYYYCQQNYQKYLEQHPYYREYYRQFYGRYGYPSGEPTPADDKASTRSGRSSINEEIKKSSLSSHFTQDFVDQSSISAYESSIYPDQYSFNCKSFASGDASRVPSVTDEAGLEMQHRMSPHLYTGPHLRASFTSGGKLLLVLPNDPKEGEKATVQLRNVQKMLAVDNAFDTRIKKLSLYPGPLTIKETHKDVVLRFCDEQALQALKTESLCDRDSVVLMWNYLSLLVKQNGNVCGADLAGLLIKGRSSFSDNPSGEPDTDEKPDSLSSFEGAHEQENKINGQTPTLFVSNQADPSKKFTELLCLGRKKEAVDHAIREKLWGHAMMLAAKMDSMTHARVMASFMQTIPGTGILQTLMQHLSGKKPEVTRNYSAEKWGDWRLHLAMMISNPTGNVQKDRSSVIALGDTLASKHRYHAAHLCYLAAEAEWGTFSDKDSKLVLIGSSPQQSFQLFASDDAIQCTEIFEFAKSLDSNNPMFFKFQSYKLIYGYRLAEFGFPNEALRYCQVITEAVMKQPNLFHVDFVAKVLELASQLKYHDVHYQMGEGEVSEMSDPEWLQYLDHTLQTLQYKAREELLQSTQSMAAEPVVRETETYSAPETDYQIASRRNSDLTRAISRSSDYSNHVPHEAFSPPNEQTTYVESSLQQDRAQVGTFYGSGTSTHVENKEPVADRLPYHSLHTISTVEPQQQEFGDERIVSSYSSPHETYSQQISPSEGKPPELHSSFHPVHQNQQHPWQPEISGHEETDTVQHYSMPQNNNQVFQPDPVHELPQQFNSQMPTNGPSGDQSIKTTERSPEEEEYWKMLSGKDKESLKNPDDCIDSSSKHEDIRKQSIEEHDLKDEDKKSAGFLGSLFGGWRKGSNQAKLPDDKNPSIVWDEQKKKWVNKDGDANDDVTPLPPPSSIMGQPPPNLRGGIKKSRYVDPVGDKGRTKTPVHSVPLPLPPMGSLPVPKVPANPEMPVEGCQDAQYLASASETTPVAVSQPPESQPVGADTSNAIPMMNPVDPQPQPLFFNPAQFQAPQGVPSKPAKRTGPAKRSYNPQR